MFDRIQKTPSLVKFDPEQTHRTPTPQIQIRSP